MNPIFVPMFAIAILTASPHSGSKDNVEQEQAIAAIKKVGGKVTMSEAKKGSPSQCIAVDLSGTRDTDAAMEHLRALVQLESLSMYRSSITDAGLKNLKGLPQLRELNLAATRVTDTGLKNLKGLTQLRRLDLGAATRITDAGLKN